MTVKKQAVTVPARKPTPKPTPIQQTSATAPDITPAAPNKDEEVDTDAIDVFVCIFGTDDLAIAKVVMDRWRVAAAGGAINLHVMCPATEDWKNLIKDESVDVFEGAVKVAVSFVGADFQRGRRIAAENLAKSAIYVLADIDCIPSPEQDIFVDLESIVSILNETEYKQFAMLSYTPDNAAITPWSPTDMGDYEAVQTRDVMEHVSVGGIRVIRAGAMPKDASAWSPQPEHTTGYDMEHAQQLRAAGYRVGYARNVDMHHLGEVNPISRS